jgi:hypothetical protein
MSWIRLAESMTAAAGRCTRCGAKEEDEFAACPMDGYCPAPNYHARRANQLFDQRICACWLGSGEACLGPLDRFHNCLSCGHAAYKTNGVFRIETPPLANDDYIPETARRTAEFRTRGI